MKHIKTVVGVVGIVVFLVLLHSAQYDNREARVVAVSDNVVTFETLEGEGVQYIYECSVNEHYKVGERVVLKMFDCETMSAVDDIIIEVEVK